MTAVLPKPQSELTAIATMLDRALDDNVGVPSLKGKVIGLINDRDAWRAEYIDLARRLHQLEGQRR